MTETTPTLDEQIKHQQYRCDHCDLGSLPMEKANLASLERLKAGTAILDSAFIEDPRDMRCYDEQGVNQAHHVLSGGAMPRETEN